MCVDRLFLGLAPSPSERGLPHRRCFLQSAANCNPVYRYFAVSLLCVLITGCGSYFAPDRNVKETLSEKDVVGSWKMSAESLVPLVRDGFRSASTNEYRIVFNPDGTCVFQSVFSFTRQHRYLAAKGSWRLEHDTTGNSNIKKKNALRIELLVEGANHLSHLNFARENGALVLWNYHGDPDQWEFVEYRRER
jgi:hypothetical protein